MAENRLKQVQKYGQSIWLDNIRKGLIASGELQRMVDEDGLRGVTSNPAIFEKAIDGSADYDDALRTLVREERSLDKIYEAIVTDDIRAAAAVLKPVFDATRGSDGFVSLEVPADIALNTDRTICEARRLHELLGLPNVMVKIPATRAGVPAIRQMIAEGRNINVTLIFSRERYADVMEAYISGLEERAGRGEPLTDVNSVASFFVSRVDTMVNNLLDKKISGTTDDAERKRLQSLIGKAGIANARLAYEDFRKTFGADRFQKLKAKGAKVQRPLWASTSVKDPQLRDVLYVESLIGPDTVDTVPPASLAAFRDHGNAGPTLESGLDEARQVFQALGEVGIDLKQVTDDLEREGIKLFEEAMEKLMHSVAVKREEILGNLLDRQTAVLPGLQEKVDARLAQMQQATFGRRYWEKDPTLWKPDAAHAKVIRNRLGWMTVADCMLEKVDELRRFADQAKRDGFTHAVVLGMGGSSLCPEALARTFQKAPGYLRLLVLDSTYPDTIRGIEADIPLETTLFIVSSKSGGTLEPNSFYQYFRKRVEELGTANPGSHFVAITDPGTSLEKLAADAGFRKTWSNPPDIGGRYSALSYFGLVPAVLMGIDIRGMLESAVRMEHSCDAGLGAADNAGLRLGAIMAEAAAAGRNKVTVVASPSIAAFGMWAEQLIAESTGKEGQGLVPVDAEPLGAPGVYGSDRLFINVQLESDPEPAGQLAALEASGHPVVRIQMADRIDLAEEFYRWEMAIGAAGALMGIDSFDEPNVQESKDNTRRVLDEFKATGKLPVEEPAATGDGIALYLSPGDAGRPGGNSIEEILRQFFAQAQPGDYAAFMAYVRPTDESWRALQQTRVSVRDRFRIATTTGYGPRFLHSTGQLHKGGPATGLFVQITAEPQQDAPIPGEPYSFGVLVGAQAAGDLRALRDHGLRVIRLHLQNGDRDLTKIQELVSRAVA
ncbi:MAG: bifunctional transaldolase/phosoglucose isomerase [Chloroflexi bacterium]|nr:bifunctional transaldolase/phosoglucose isomerase [Chloroflexota bacterium]